MRKKLTTQLDDTNELDDAIQRGPPPVISQVQVPMIVHSRQLRVSLEIALQNHCKQGIVSLDRCQLAGPTHESRQVECGPWHESTHHTVH